MQNRTSAHTDFRLLKALAAAVHALLALSTIFVILALLYSIVTKPSSSCPQNYQFHFFSDAWNYVLHRANRHQTYLFCKFHSNLLPIILFQISMMISSIFLFITLHLAESARKWEYAANGLIAMLLIVALANFIYPIGVREIRELMRIYFASSVSIFMQVFILNIFLFFIAAALVFCYCVDSGWTKARPPR